MKNTPTDKKDFSPPSVEQLEQHLRDHPPTPPSPLVSMAPLLVLGAAFILLLLPQGPTAYLALVLVAGMLFWLVNRIRKQRKFATAVANLQESATLRYWPDVLASAWRLLPMVTQWPDLHARTVAAIAHCLDQVRSYDSAIFAYNYLIKRVPKNHPGTVQLQLHRTMAQLASDHLADADDALRKLRKIPAVGQPQSPNVLSAMFRMAHLIQQVRTFHWDDAVAQAQGLEQDLQPLGIEAGYGYALMSLSYHQLPVNMDIKEEKPRQTAKWWSQATLLLPPGELTKRFTELTPLTTDPAVTVATLSCVPPQSSNPNV